ncbi:hypothetical protein V8E36_002393 [Tilletia maclaganii]
MIPALRSALVASSASASSSSSVCCVRAVSTAAAAKRFSTSSTSAAAAPRTFLTPSQQQQQQQRSAANKSNIIATALAASRAFSSSAVRASHGESDAELAQQLGLEIEYEREQAAAEAAEQGGADDVVAAATGAAQPEFVRSFLDSASAWTIDDAAGSDEVVLKREFGNEHIRVLYSIGDIDTHAAQSAIDDAAADPSTSTAGAEESAEGGSGAALDDEYSNIPIRAAITISKTSAGAMTLEALVQDGAWVIENISFYNDAKLATDPTAEADWARRGLYIGPQFDTLDLKVQEQFENFLEERGFDAPLAIFIVQYAEYKEQNEYRTWLERVKAFVEA